MANQDEVLVKFRADANEVLSEVNKIESSVKKMSNTVDASQKAINRSTQKTAYGFNGLGNSINQLSRELPAFTYSAQTGFLALSNNIPMLADQITNLKNKNIELVASGQKSIPVWKSLVSALVSWQTALSLGVTLLTIYGKEIGEFVVNMFKAEKAVIRLTEAQRLLNEIRAQGAKNSSVENFNIEVNKKAIENANIAESKRVALAEKMIEKYPKIFKNVTTEMMLNGQAEQSYKTLRQAILDRNQVTEGGVKAKDLDAQIQDQKTKLNDLDRESLLIKEDLYDAEQKYSKEQQKNANVLIGSVDQSKSLGKINDLSKRQNEIKAEYLKTTTEISKLEATRIELERTLSEQVESSLLLEKEKAETIKPLRVDRIKQLKTEKLTIKEIDDELENVYIVTQKIAEINQDFEFVTPEDLANADALNEKWEKIRRTKELAYSTAIDLSSSLLEISNNLTQTEIDNQEMIRDSKIKSLDDQLERGTINEKKYQSEKTKAEKKADQEISNLRMQQQQREKAVASFQAILKGGLATLQAFIELGPIAGALVGLSVAAEVAAIQSQPLPKFEKGGLIQGKSHRHGGVIIEAEGNEFIVNKLQTPKHMDVLEHINKGSFEEYNKRRYIIPALKKERENIRQSIINSFNDANLLSSDQKNREILREIRDALKEGRTYTNKRKI